MSTAVALLIALFLSLPAVVAGAAAQAGQLAGVISVTTHGAKCDGATDDTAAFDDAFAAGPVIYVPPGVCLLTSLAMVKSKDFHLFGAGIGISILKFVQKTGNGITISQDNFNHYTYIHDLSILTTQAEPGDGLSITYAGTDARENRSFVRTLIERFEIRGDDITKHGWARGVVATDIHNLDIRDCVVAGRKNTTVKGKARFLNMTDAILAIGLKGNPSSVSVSGCRVWRAKNGYRAAGNYEGFVVDNSIAVAVGTGLKSDRSRARPWTRSIGNHFSVFDFGIDIDGSPQSFLNDNLIYKFREAESDTWAIRIRNSNIVQISGNVFYNLARDAATQGEWHGISVIDSSYVSMRDNFHERFSTGIKISGRSTRVTSRDNSFRGKYRNAARVEHIDRSSGKNTHNANPSVR